MAASSHACRLPTVVNASYVPGVSVGALSAGFSASPYRQASPDEDVDVLRPVVVGVWRSDLAREVLGERLGPSQFGHDIVASVVASSVNESTRGGLVSIDPNRAVRRSTGFARHVWAAGDRRVLLDFLIPLPAGRDPLRLIFVEPLACAIHCVATARRCTANNSLVGTDICVRQRRRVIDSYTATTYLNATVSQIPRLASAAAIREAV
jgi:hypothetical protein